MRRIELQRDFVARAENCQLVVKAGEQWQHIAVASVGSRLTRVRTGAADLLVDIFHIPGRLRFNLPRIAVEIEVGSAQRNWSQA